MVVQKGFGRALFCFLFSRIPRPRKVTCLEACETAEVEPFLWNHRFGISVPHTRHFESVELVLPPGRRAPYNGSRRLLVLLGCPRRCSLPLILPSFPRHRFSSAEVPWMTEPSSLNFTLLWSSRPEFCRLQGAIEVLRRELVVMSSSMEGDVNKSR